VGDLLREYANDVEGEHVARAYAKDVDDGWEAWLEFTSLRTGELRRTGVKQLAPTKDELMRWADGLRADELARALEDAEIGAVSDLGTPPRQL
jgi:hypothetical protein